VIFKQFYLGCLAHASYLIGDEASGVAAVVDPQRDVDQYISFAAEHGLKIKHVFLTHLHADFVAGHLEMRDRAGATIYLGAKAKAGYAFVPFGDGATIEFGKVRLKTMETPGHTPESISILVFDLNVSDTKPNAVLTGDTLFIGDVGRPDCERGVVGDATGEMCLPALTVSTLPDDSPVSGARRGSQAEAISKRRCRLWVNSGARTTRAAP
jgi:glyoxylase-like metal-dependent hydrolase (beta-lactamase superfamily II)